MFIKCVNGGKLTFLGVVFLAIFFVNGDAFAADENNILIITHKDVPASLLSEEDIKQIFLGKKTKWRNNQKIRFATLSKKDEHKRFLKKYVGKTSIQYSHYFKQLIFTGKGKAPRSFSSSDHLVDYVANTQGAIGYISSKFEGQLENVNVIIGN